MVSSSTIRLLPAVPADIPKLARISAQAFNNDTHTQLNCLTKGTDFDMSPALSSWIALPDSKCVVIKAVLSPTPNKQGREEEEIAGWVCWSFKGLNNDNIVEKGSVDAEHKDVTDKRSSIEDGMKTQEHDQEREKISSDTSLSKIERLNAITNASMSFWQNKLTPQNAKCLILVALTVSPSQQGQGIGSSLIRCGTHIADEQGVYAGFHVQTEGIRLLRKLGLMN